MFICLCCGAEFRQPRCHEEDRGEQFGFPAREKMYGCPRCGGAYAIS